MILAGVIGYLLLLGAIAARRIDEDESADSFFVAGRHLPARLVVCTLAAAWIGSGTLFATAGLAYRVGIAALWQTAGACLGIAILWRLAPEARTVAKHTLPELFEHRFGVTARAIVTAIVIVSYTAIAAVQIGAGGRLLALVAGLDLATGTTIAALICVGFAAAAGLRSIAALDAVHAAAIVIGLIVGVVYLSSTGAGSVRAAVRPEQLTIFGSLHPLTCVFVLFLPSVFLVAGDASVYQKTFAARDSASARRALIVWLGATLAIEVLLVTLAILGSAAMPLLQGGAADTIIVGVALGMLHPAAALFVVIAALAIVFSSATTFLFTAGTSAVNDVYRRFIAPDAERDRLVWMARYAIATSAIAALTMLQLYSSLLETALWTYAMAAAVIAPPLIASLLLDVPRRAALYGMAVGLLVTVLLEAVVPRIPAVLPAAIFATVTVLFMSRLKIKD